jgi:hypothetical protein
MTETRSRKAKYLYVLTIDVDSEKEEEFNNWYNTEHIPGMLRQPGFLSANRYVTVEGTPQYLSVYEIESPEVLKNSASARKQASDTEWKRRLQPYYHVLTRKVYKRVYPE